ncbi:hypothetical protein [Enterococcus pallens]|uniref:Uncharacterized protein n=1 Tax=Enterococcus pallens ATCC BAA-351 TaxID=1158607 RepID=R2QIG3_9ENTE|nr:hypothetical protein [Enterococcus pallens]EOH96402.1 hypothetical protein UAU_01053 [Enterococcus pallens ATCC BAA-351]EOU14385.1 hypothetical protein I588_04741 [Enterococcus pallens ATCC BAA-351]
MKYNLTVLRKELYTFKDASIKLGKKPNYLNQMFKLHPDWFHPDTIMHIGRENIISEEGINFYKDNASIRAAKKAPADQG